MKSVASIPINQYLGVQYNQAKEQLELPENDQIKNHFGNISFCAQLTLAESASAQYLFEQLDMSLESEIPTLRNSKVKFYKPTNGTSIAKLVSMSHNKDKFQILLSTKGKGLVNIKIAVQSTNETKALVGDFEWLVLRKA